MELDDLKTKWSELEGRLDGTNARTEQLAAEVAAGKITSAKQRLVRMTRLGIFILAMLPLLFLNIFRYDEVGPGVTVKVLLALFIFAMLIRQVLLLVLLGRIEPGRQSVCEACAAVLRFRSCFLAGVGVGIVLAVPLFVALGIFMGRMTTPYVLYGFVAGLVIGLPLGVRIFLRMLGDINALRAALQGAAE